MCVCTCVKGDREERKEEREEGGEVWGEREVGGRKREGRERGERGRREESAECIEAHGATLICSKNKQLEAEVTDLGGEFESLKVTGTKVQAHQVNLCSVVVKCVSILHI